MLRQGFDFVAPLYHRHKYDGTITNSIVYPLTRALYGKRVRQPIGGDFGFSGRLAEHYLGHDVWESDVARFGIDIWMTTTAITGGFRVCQSFLGAKIHDAKDPVVDLSAMLDPGRELGLRPDGRPRAAGGPCADSSPFPTFGFEYTVGLEPVRSTSRACWTVFRSGVAGAPLDLGARTAPGDLGREHRPDRRSAATTRSASRPELWVRVVYDFAVAYHGPAMDREHLLRSLTPLYLGRTASFVIETARRVGRGGGEPDRGALPGVRE